MEVTHFSFRLDAIQSRFHSVTQVHYTGESTTRVRFWDFAIFTDGSWPTCPATKATGPRLFILKETRHYLQTDSLLQKRRWSLRVPDIWCYRGGVPRCATTYRDAKHVSKASATWKGTMAYISRSCQTVPSPKPQNGRSAKNWTGQVQSSRIVWTF